MPPLDPRLMDRLDEKLRQLNDRRPLPPAVVGKLQKQFEIEMTYNSNAIEGNRLTLKETLLVLNEGITVKNRSLKEHLEAKDHYEALEFLSDLVAHHRRHTVSEHLVRTLHALVVKDTFRQEAGKYRLGEVRISGSTHRPPSAQDVPHEMKEMIRAFSISSKDHPVARAARLHHRFVHIHPFTDGNGRTGRLLMNVLLMQEGYPLAVILKNDRKRYYDALSKADHGDMGPITRLVAQSVERSLDLYLRATAPDGAGVRRGDRYQPLSELAKHTRFSAKYLNLLARQGKLEAHKEGRDWLSSRSAIDRYLLARLRKR